MKILVAILLISIILTLIQNFLKKNYYKKLTNILQKQWSKPKKDEYFNFDRINQYFRNTKNKKNAFHIITEQIKNDLDIDEVFKFLDRTTSKIGQQYLYYKIRVIQPKQKLEKFNRLTQLFLKNDKLRLKCQSELIKLNNHSNYDLESLVNDGIVEKPGYKKFLLPLSILSIIIIIGGIFHREIFLFLIPVFFINISLHYKTKSYINYYLSAINQLNKSLAVSQKLISFTQIKNHFPNTTFIKKITEIRLKTKFISFERQLNNEILIILWVFTEIFKILFNFEAILFYSFIDDILIKHDNIDQLFQFIGEIDSAISVASIKSGDKLTCKPIFVDDKYLKIKEITHPLIENCIPNDIQLNKKSLLLTGSNMSGKTTFIRTVALNSILAETLGFAFAKEFTIPFYKVYTSIRITDDILKNTSYYLEEVLTIKKLLEASKNKTPELFVLDEIFKGTNTIERISGGKAILSYLNTIKDFVFVSTHDVELTELLQKNNYDLYHFSEQIQNNKLFFDHKLKKGKLKTRNAIKILELYGYPKQIIVDAKKTEKENF